VDVREAGNREYFEADTCDNNGEQRMVKLNEG
jgi:hypothetical protein